MANCINCGALLHTNGKPAGLCGYCNADQEPESPAGRASCEHKEEKLSTGVVVASINFIGHSPKRVCGFCANNVLLVVMAHRLAPQGMATPMASSLPLVNREALAELLAIPPGYPFHRRRYQHSEAVDLLAANYYRAREQARLTVSVQE